MHSDAVGAAPSLPAVVQPRVSAIVRTTGDSSRAGVLRRAIRSILQQAAVNIDCIVVFNSDAHNAELLQWVEQQPHTRTVVLGGPDKAAATLIGRAMVGGDFFCFLDDDDEFLPGALCFGANYLMEHPRLDCVATNGYYVDGDNVRILLEDADRFAQDGYIPTLLRARNWLASCGGMFRTATVGEKYFRDLTHHREWTLIAFRIASDLHVQFVNLPTCRVYSMPHSQSKKTTYVDAAVETLDAMLRWNKDPRNVPVLRKRQADAYRNAASYYRINGDFPRAWRMFRRALVLPGGWRHLPYAALLLARDERPVTEVQRQVSRFLPARTPIVSLAGEVLQACGMTSPPPGLNDACSGLSRLEIDVRFRDIFGYGLYVDPQSYSGAMYRRPIRGEDDPRLFHGPLLRAEDDFVYQPSIKYGTIRGAVEWRAFAVAGRVVAVHRVFRTVQDGEIQTEAELSSAYLAFSDAEAERLNAFCQSVDIDFGVLEVLRDERDQRLYVRECDFDPPTVTRDLIEEERRHVIRDTAAAFAKEYVPQKQSV